MYNELLPIGSVVQVKDAKREFMICGRVVARLGSDEVYDYVAVVYPEGLLDINNLYFFNRNAVEACVYRGYESQEEYDFKENVLAPLDEVEVIDGKVVPKKQSIR